MSNSITLAERSYAAELAHAERVRALEQRRAGTSLRQKARALTAARRMRAAAAQRGGSQAASDDAGSRWRCSASAS